jgi:membrane protease YdiL (CAAX protease family)
VLISTLLLIVAVTLVKYICTIIFKGANAESIALEKSNIWFYILAVCLIPAIFEELFFRGIVFSLYEKKYGTVCAIITSSLLFALYHFSLPDFLTYFTAGIIIGFALHITGSVICAIFMHFVSNTLNIFLNNAIFKFAKDGIGNTLVIILLLALLLLVLSFWLGKLQNIYFQRAALLSNPTDENKSSFGYTSCTYGFRNTIFYTIISPPFILCIVLFIIYIL